MPLDPAPNGFPVTQDKGMMVPIWIQWLNLLRLQVNVAPTFNVVDLPMNYAAGSIAYVPNATGSVTLAFFDGTNWLRSDTGAIVS